MDRGAYSAAIATGARRARIGDLSLNLHRRQRIRSAAFAACSTAPADKLNASNVASSHADTCRFLVGGALSAIINRTAVDNAACSVLMVPPRYYSRNRRYEGPFNFSRNQPSRELRARTRYATRSGARHFNHLHDESAEPSLAGHARGRGSPPFGSRPLVFTSGENLCGGLRGLPASLRRHELRQQPGCRPAMVRGLFGRISVMRSQSQHDRSVYPVVCQSNVLAVGHQASEEGSIFEVVRASHLIRPCSPSRSPS